MEENIATKLIADDEVFVPIEKSDNFYYISNYGRVWSNKTKSLMKPSLNNVGYSCVQFRDGEDVIRMLVHRLVAQYFVPNPLFLKEVNHIDGNKQNNKYSNLEWCTRSQNMKHAFETGLKVNKKGGENPLAKTIHQFDLQGNYICSWSAISTAARKFCEQHPEITTSPEDVRKLITQNLTGNSKTCLGYIFSYTEDINLEEHIHVIPNARPIIGESLDDGHIVTYQFVNECARDGFDPTNVCKCCNGKRASHKGFKWRYADSDFVPLQHANVQFKPVIAIYTDTTSREFKSLSDACREFNLDPRRVSYRLLKYGKYNCADSGVMLTYATIQR